MKRPRIYHLTSEPWWILIAQSGDIVSTAEKQRRGISPAPGESMKLGEMVVHTVEHRFPEAEDVVDKLAWFTQVDKPTQQWQTPELGPYGKGEFRIEVDAPFLVRWPTYARNVGFSKLYYDSMNKTGEMQAEMWWVSEQPVTIEHWVQVVRTSDGAVIYDRNES